MKKSNLLSKINKIISQKPTKTHKNPQPQNTKNHKKMVDAEEAKYKLSPRKYIPQLISRRFSLLSEIWKRGNLPSQCQKFYNVKKLMAIIIIWSRFSMHCMFNQSSLKKGSSSD